MSLKIRCSTIANVNKILVVAKRAVAGDGNCFFRSVAFSALEDIIAKRDPYCIAQFKSLLTSAIQFIRPYHRQYYDAAVLRIFNILDREEHTKTLEMEFAHERDGTISTDSVLCDLIRITTY